MTTVVDIGRLDNCPNCSSPWKGFDIYQYFLRQKNDPDAPQHASYRGRTDEDILEVAGHYGYTLENPVHFRRVIGIEMPYGHPKRRDGVSYWKCPDCEVAWDRFTGEQTEEFMSKELSDVGWARGMPDKPGTIKSEKRQTVLSEENG